MEILKALQYTLVKYIMLLKVKKKQIAMVGLQGKAIPMVKRSLLLQRHKSSPFCAIIIMKRKTK